MGHFPNWPEGQGLRGRAVLKLHSPLIESALAASHFDQHVIQQAALWGNVLLCARDAWADQYRRGRRYSDAPADRHQNRLEWQNRGRA